MMHGDGPVLEDNEFTRIELPCLANTCTEYCNEQYVSCSEQEQV